MSFIGIEGFANDEGQGLTSIKQAIGLSAHILLRDPLQLASQLTGRLLRDGSKPVQRLLAGALTKKETWLRPLTASLDSTGGARYRTLIGHNESVNGLAFTPDSNQIISASTDGSIRIWDIHKGAEMEVLRDHPGSITSLAITPNGKWAIAGCYDGTIQVWELRSKRKISILEGHSGPVRSIRCTPDSQLAVSASQDGTLRVWKLDQPGALFILKGHTAAVNAVAITPDGGKAVSASADKTLRIWSLEDGNELARMQSSWEQFAVAITPDGLSVISGSEMVPIAWGLESLVETAILTDFEGPLHESDVRGVAITPDGRQVVSGDRDGKLITWNLGDNFPLHGVSLITWATHQNGITDIAISPDGRWCASASQDRTIIIWNLATPKSTAHGNPIKWIGFGNSQEIIGLSVGYKSGQFGDDSEWESTLWIGDNRFNWSLRARDVALSGNHDILFVAVDNGIQVFDIPKRTLMNDRFFGVWAMVAVSADGHLLLCFNWRTSELQLWNRNTGESFILDPNTRSVETIAITSDNQWGVVGAKDGNLRIWSLPDFSQQKTIKAHAGSIKAFALDNSGRVFSCGEDGYIHRWDLARGVADLSIKLDWMKSNSLLVSGDGCRIAAVSEDGAAMTWDVSTGRPLVGFTAGSVKTNGVPETYLPGKCLSNFVLLNEHEWAVVNDGEKVALWNLASGSQLASLTGDSIFETCAISPDDSILVVGTNSGEMHILAIEPSNRKKMMDLRR
jgi:WD40 repeat protein